MLEVSAGGMSNVGHRVGFFHTFPANTGGKLLVEICVWVMQMAAALSFLLIVDIRVIQVLYRTVANRVLENTRFAPE
jgi:hypothetical protein